MRNPSWTKDELILALDVYLDIYPEVPDDNLEEIKDLSLLLRSMDTKGHIANKTFRSPTGVTMKFMNFKNIDPRYSGKGLSAISKIDQEVWDEFAHDKNKLKTIVSIIKDNIGFPLEDFDEFSYMSEAIEGKKITKLHTIRERNPKLIRDKKRRELKSKGKLVCTVCGFDFAETYGARGHDFMECHHIKPLHELGETKTKLKDLVLVCSNCHRMIHAKKPWLTVEELKSITLCKKTESNE